MKKLAVLHHYFHPDPNVSSVHFSELASGLAQLGWNVTAYPGNRNIDDPSVEYLPSEAWHGVQIRRIWRPHFRRGSGIGRILSAAWMIVRWSLLALWQTPDVIILGTDPILAVLVARIWRLLRPRTFIALWVFDIYPEVAYAEGLIRNGGALSRILTALLKPSYAACDVIVDIGPCMRKHLRKYEHHRKETTLVPWALTEPQTAPPVAREEREQTFGSAALALMYSGTFGRAHSFDDILELMAALEGSPIHLAFSVKGQRETALRAAASARSNISFVPFASKERLHDRLSAPDIHVVSLRDEWTGMVIPSKFFGALAAGRPVLFCGSAQSSLAVWIREYDLGWVLEPGRAKETAAQLRRLLADPGAMQELRDRCHSVYQERFSRSATLAGWDAVISKVNQPRGSHRRRS